MREMWICYPMISSVIKNRGSALLSKNVDIRETSPRDHASLFEMCSLKLLCKDFTIVSFDFKNVGQADDVFESIKKLTVLEKVDQLYAYIYQPNPVEMSLPHWEYSPEKEFSRQQVPMDQWRFTKLNEEYQLCKSYPKKLMVPHSVSDTLLKHAVKFRSQSRLPALTYFYKKNGVCIARCAQPLYGLTQQRSIQDEKLLQEFFSMAGRRNIIVDARPTTNAMAQTALGAGTENMDNYKFADEKTYLGIDNIHVMRDSLNQVYDLLADGDLNLPLDPLVMNKLTWKKHIKRILSSTDKLAKSMIFNDSNLLVHCSDGWDRTAQICALIQLCLDPYFRTLDGFMTLVEKDWLGFGHKFAERCGHLSSDSAFYDNLSSISNVSNHFKRKQKFTAPIFHQFLDCVYQLMNQYPTSFEFNERFLRRLLYHVYSCQYGTFLFDTDQERQQASLRSVWDYFRSRKPEFTSKQYVIETGPEDWILPDFSKVTWWWQLFGRTDEELNGFDRDITPQSSLG